MLPLTKHITLDNPHCRPLTIAHLWTLTARREAYRTAYAQRWNEADIDVLLCPAGPSAAPKHDTAKWWGYTSQWNLLDYPSLVFPAGQVDVARDGRRGPDAKGYAGRNEWDRENWAWWEQVGAEGYVDAPLGLQLIGRRFQEEELFLAMEVISRETGQGDARFV